MTALAKPRMARVKKAGGMDFPVKGGEEIFKGAYVVLDAGYLAPASVSTSLTPVGRASDSVDNGGGNDGDESCHVDFMKEKTLFPFIGKTAEFDQGDMGAPAYLDDDQTVTKDNSGRTAAGTAWKFESSNGTQIVWVEV